jgi:hypothetical protein
MPGITQLQARHQGALFDPPNPIGIVCHRTEGGFNRVLHGFVHGNRRHVSAHFLIGKLSGYAVQLLDTSIRSNHVGPGANELFIGIEFESIEARRGWEHRQDPLVNADPLTPFQIQTGREVINWSCTVHNIRRKGPPDHAEMVQCQGRFNGLLNHSDLTGFFHTDHGDGLRAADWAALLPTGLASVDTGPMTTIDTQ